MNTQSLWIRLVGTLRRQALALALGSILVSAAVAGPLAHQFLGAEARAVLDHRGRVLIRNLPHDEDLRQALEANDPSEVQPFLNAIVAEDPDVASLTVLRADRTLLAAAPGIPDEATRGAVERALAGRSGDDAFVVAPIRRTNHPRTMAGPDENAPAADDVLGYVAVGLAVEAMRHRVASQVTTAIGAGALVLFLFALLLFFRRVTTRLGQMVAQAEAVADGELRARIDDRSPDELGRLAGALNRMAEQTGRVVVELRRAGASLAASSEEVRRCAEGRAESARRQAVATTEMTTTASELRATSQVASEKAETVIVLAEQSIASSRSGTVAVKQSAEGMLRVHQEVEAVSEAFGALLRETTQIEALVGTLKDLAERSHMLALNAAIESTRAGESGRGFAVVSREMRALADQSRREAAGARERLQHLLGRGSTVAEASGRVREQAGAGNVLAEAAGGAIEALASTISDSSNAATQIAASTRQAAVGVEQLFAAIQDFDLMSKESAGETEELAGAAEELGRLATRMTALVERYRIEEAGRRAA